MSQLPRPSSSLSTSSGTSSVSAAATAGSSSTATTASRIARPTGATGLPKPAVPKTGSQLDLKAKMAAQAAASTEKFNVGDRVKLFDAYFRPSKFNNISHFLQVWVG